MSMIEEGDLVSFAVSAKFEPFLTQFKVGLVVDINVRQTDGFFWESEEVVTVMWPNGKCTAELRNHLRRL